MKRQGIRIGLGSALGQQVVVSRSDHVGHMRVSRQPAIVSREQREIFAGRPRAQKRGSRMARRWRDIPSLCAVRERKTVENKRGARPAHSGTTGLKKEDGDNSCRAKYLILQNGGSLDGRLQRNMGMAMEFGTLD